MARGLELFDQLVRQTAPAVGELYLASQAHKDKRPDGRTGYAVRSIPSLLDAFNTIKSLVQWSAPHVSAALNTVKQQVGIASPEDLTGYWQQDGTKDASVVIIHNTDYGLLSFYIPDVNEEWSASGLGFRTQEGITFWVHTKNRQVSMIGSGYGRKLSFTYIENDRFTDFYTFSRR